MMDFKEYKIFEEVTPATSKRYKKRKRSELSCDELTKIVFECLVKKRTRIEVALIHRVSV